MLDFEVVNFDEVSLYTNIETINNIADTFYSPNSFKVPPFPKKDFIKLLTTPLKSFFNYKDTPIFL